VLSFPGKRDSKVLCKDFLDARLRGHDSHGVG